MVSKNIVRQNAPKPEKYIIFFGSPVEEKNLHFNNFLTIFKTPALQLIQIPKKFSFHSAKPINSHCGTNATGSNTTHTTQCNSHSQQIQTAKKPNIENWLKIHWMTQNAQFKIQVQHLRGILGVYLIIIDIYHIWYQLFDSTKSAIFERLKLGTFDQPTHPSIRLYLFTIQNMKFKATSAKELPHTL